MTGPIWMGNEEDYDYYESGDAARDQEEVDSIHAEAMEDHRRAEEKAGAG